MCISPRAAAAVTRASNAPASARVRAWKAANATCSRPSAAWSARCSAPSSPHCRCAFACRAAKFRSSSTTGWGSSSGQRRSIVAFTSSAWPASRWSRLLEEVRTAEIVHLDETPWYQRGALMWMWVAVTATAVVFRIGSRRKEEFAALIGEAFLGWLVTDGYAAYRDHPRRQRCLAHLIRKAWRSPTGSTATAPASAAISARSAPPHRAGP